ncbi:tyrosine-type recombinase/integrase [Bacteroides caccae]|uniref:tyrosine-type recombinase/integrase n=1 Tax=Bacteroides caccae TaxID=47678 RepID=UPI00359CA3B7
MLAKCLIINVLRLIIVILFFIAFLNITYVARHTFACIALANKVSMETIARMLGHSDIRTTKIYAKVLDTTVSKEMEVMKHKFAI